MNKNLQAVLSFFVAGLAAMMGVKTVDYLVPPAPQEIRIIVPNCEYIPEKEPENVKTPVNRTSAGA